MTGTRSDILKGIGIAVCLAANMANAATVRLTRSSSNGFTNAYGWDSGNPPESGNDYIVADGYYLRGDYSEGFAGDSLQFGIVGGTEGIFFKEHQGTHTFTKLILANGYYRTWMSSNGQAGHIAGSVEVTSPESAPFRLHSTHNSGLGWYITYWDAAMTGAEGTGLKIGPYLLATYNSAHLSTGQTIFTGDNSGYLGSITVYGTNAVFAFTTGNSLGGTLSSFKADAFTLCDGTTVESRGDNVTLSSSLNRGVTVDATGGRLHVGGDKALRLEWPVTGTGPLYKVGNGRLTLAAPLSLTASDPAAACLTVSNGCLAFASGFSNGGGVISVLEGSETTVPAGDEVTVRNLALDGALRISYDESMATSGVLVLDGSCTPSWPIPVYPPNVRGAKVPFLKVPTSIKTVTKNDFSKPDNLAASGLPSANFTVETAGGIQTVYAEVSKIVTVSNASSRAYLYPYTSDKWMWSDNAVVHSGADYVIGAGKTIYSTGMSGNFTLVGDSITFAGSGTGSRATWELGNASLTKFTGDVRMGNYVMVKPTAADNSELHIDGKLYAYGTAGSDGSLDFRAAKNGITVVIDSVISGSGWMSFQPLAAGYTNTYCFAGDNTFNGGIFVYQGYSNTLTTIKFAKESSWGTDATSLKDSMIFQGSMVLYPVGSQTINLPNRRIKFYATGQKVRVDDGEVFDLRSPLFFNNGGSEQYATVVKKIGGGTWAVGGTVIYDRNGISAFPSLTIEEGFVRPDNPRAFQSINVTVSEGAGIAAKYRPGDTSEVATYGMIVTNATRFAVSGSTLKFKVATGGAKLRASESIAILTVPEETATAIDAKAIKFEHDNAYGRCPELLKDAVTVSGRPCVRYSCRFINGFMINIR